MILDWHSLLAIVNWIILLSTNKTEENGFQKFAIARGRFSECDLTSAVLDNCDLFNATF
jgi:hypothetical protein